jgi:hypothetical protein
LAVVIHRPVSASATICATRHGSFFLRRARRCTLRNHFLSSISGTGCFPLSDRASPLLGGDAVLPISCSERSAFALSVTGPSSRRLAWNKARRAVPSGCQMTKAKSAPFLASRSLTGPDDFLLYCPQAQVGPGSPPLAAVGAASGAGAKTEAQMGKAVTKPPSTAAVMVSSSMVRRRPFPASWLSACRKAASTGAGTGAPSSSSRPRSLDRRLCNMRVLLGGEILRHVTASGSLPTALQVRAHRRAPVLRR